MQIRRVLIAYSLPLRLRTKPLETNFILEWDTHQIIQVVYTWRGRLALCIRHPMHRSQRMYARRRACYWWHRGTVKSSLHIQNDLCGIKFAFCVFHQNVSFRFTLHPAICLFSPFARIGASFMFPLRNDGGANDLSPRNFKWGKNGRYPFSATFVPSRLTQFCGVIIATMIVYTSFWCTNSIYHHLNISIESLMEIWIGRTGNTVTASLRKLSCSSDLSDLLQ